MATVKQRVLGMYQQKLAHGLSLLSEQVGRQAPVHEQCGPMCHSR